MKWRKPRGGGEQQGEPGGEHFDELVRGIMTPRGPSAFELAMRAADAEPVLRTRMLLVLAAIRNLLDRGDDQELARDRRGVQAGLAEAARIAPDTAVRLLCDVADRCGIEHAAARQVLEAWAREPVAAEFARTWFAVEGLLGDHADLGVWLATSIRAESHYISPEFERLAREHLVGLIDKHFERYEFTGPTTAVWQLLYALGPASRSEWFLRLGDLAAARGEEVEAARRYELAERFGGGAQARERLDRLQDIAAYHRLEGGVTATDKLKGAGTPSPYRHLVLGAAAVMAGRSPDARITEVVRSRDDRLRDPATLLTALDRLRTGDSDGARTQLRSLTGDSTNRTRGDGADAIVANARVLLGALDGDDQLITDGARGLLARYASAWPGHALVDATTVLSAVSRLDPALFAEMIGATGEDPNGELRELHLKVAGSVLAEAAHAELFGHRELAESALARATHLLAGVDGAEAIRLRDTAARIAEIAARRASDATDRPLDRLAFHELRVGGERQPWTPAALELWRRFDAETTGPASGSGDPRGLHHLAIAEHARAYQLELDGDAGAFEQWQRALAVWTRLHADDRFWNELRAHLVTVTPDTTPEDIARTVDNARAELPGQLLEPHVTRVQELRRDQPGRAREHLALIRTAAFAPDDVARARARLAREAGAQIRRLIREDNLDRALDEARAWVEIDADNIPLAEQALDIGIEVVEGAQRHGKGWAERAHTILERVAETVEPLCLELGLTPRQLATELPPKFDDPDRTAFAAKYARHEFWFGLTLLVTTVDRIRSDSRADRTALRVCSNHLSTALKLGLPKVSPYDQARELLVAAGDWSRYSQGHALGFF